MIEPTRWVLTLLAACALSAAQDDPVLSLQDPIRVRPGSTVTIPYTLSNWSGLHLLNLFETLSAVSITAATDDRTITLITTSGATATSSTLQLQAINTLTMSEIARCTVALAIDPRPGLQNPTQTITVAEDVSSQVDVYFTDNTLTLLSFLAPSPQTRLTATITPTPLIPGLCRLSLQSTADFNGSTTLRITVNDTTPGDPTHFDIPVTVTPVNDPPAVELVTLPTPTMHPDLGTPVAVLERVRITPGVDLDVVNRSATVGATTTYLGWQAEIVGTGLHPSLSGVDVLALRGDATYRVDATTITELSSGLAIAKWSQPDGRSDRVEVTLRSPGTQAQLEDLARLLRYTYLQNPATAFTRQLRLTVSEPDPAGGSDASAPILCPITVAAVNRPPVVTLAPLTVTPMGSGSLDIHLSDADGLESLTVRVVAPLPGGGRIEPLVCTGTQAVAGALRYTHTASDLSDDRVTLAVSDASETVVAATTIAIRTIPDRISIVSDPLFAAVRSSTTAWPLAAVPAGCTFAVRNYGAPFPPCPAGVSISGGELRFDWDTIPDDTAWIALAVEASHTSFPTAAVQRMLIRVRPPAAVGSLD